jgi:hypothetical protein
MASRRADSNAEPLFTKSGDASAFLTDVGGVFLTPVRNQEAIAERGA